MKILFCKIAAMKYYRGVSDDDIPYNGGSYINENENGNEVYNFSPIDTEDGAFCFGCVETKSTANGLPNKLHIEKINGCEQLKKEDFVEGVLVVWCATTDMNETSVVGWYKNATVYRNYEYIDIHFTDDVVERQYNIVAKAEDCVLLPHGERHMKKWDAPVSKKRNFGFGQALVWYAEENKIIEKAKPGFNKYINEIVKSTNEYNDENWIWQGQ